MANFHSDEWINRKIKEHYTEAKEHFAEDRIVGIFNQGSGNYGLDIESSDVDTKLIITPTFEDIAMNRPAVSTTYVRANDEHIDFKDIRLMLQTFKKQNLNFTEVLFTDYKIINPKYKCYWDTLIKNREAIAHYNIYSAVKAMKGVALEKYHALRHQYPNKLEVLARYGYDPKQLHHLLRVEEYIYRYIKGEPYIDCLKPKTGDYLVEVKLGKYKNEEVDNIANKALTHIEEMCTPYTKDSEFNRDDEAVDKLLYEVQLGIMAAAILS